MSSKIDKIRIGVYIDREVLKRVDKLVEGADVRSRNEFVAEAIKFYAEYLNAQKAENYLS